MTKVSKKSQTKQSCKAGVRLRCESLFYKYFKKIIDKEIEEEENQKSW